MNECNIFAGGELCDQNYIYRHIPAICADSGYRHALELDIKPLIIIGDFDSYKGELPENTEIIRCKPEKDDTDTMLAVKTAIERGFDRIYLYGGTGGRLDHTIANIQTMIYAYNHGCQIEMYAPHTALFIQGEGFCTYQEQFEEKSYFSVFALSEELHIRKLSGVKYPLENHVIKNSFPLGVSNEIICQFADLDIKSGLALVMFCEK